MWRRKMDNEIIKHLHEVGIWLDLDGDEAEAQIIYDAVDYAEELEKKVKKLTEYIDSYQDKTNIMLERIKKIEDELEERANDKIP
jgi:hypothetical protein